MQATLSCLTADNFEDLQTSLEKIMLHFKDFWYGRGAHETSGDVKSKGRMASQRCHKGTEIKLLEQNETFQIQYGEINKEYDCQQALCSGGSVL